MLLTSPTSWGVDPAHDIGHGAVIVQRRGREEGRPAIPSRRRTRSPRRPSSPRPWPPRTVRPRPGRASRHWPQPVRGDQVLARAPVAPVGSMHQTWPRRALCPQCVPQEVALDAGGHDGTAPPQNRGDRQARRLPALRRSDHHQGLCPLRRQARQPRHTREDAEEEAAPAGAPSGATRSGREVTSPGPARAPRLRSGHCVPAVPAPSWRRRRTTCSRDRVAAPRRGSPITSFVTARPT